jgi:hypothetical protein
MKTPIYGVGFPWISLDSLVRIKTYQWVTRDKSEKVFRIGFSVMSAATGQGPGSWHVKAQHRHGASLSQFLISCNQLPSKPVSLSGSIQMQPALAARAQMPLNPKIRLGD